MVDVVGDIAGEAGLRRFGAARADRSSAGAGIVFNLDTQIPAQLDAGVGAGNVVEAVSVQAADFDILDARGRPRHVGGLRPSGRNESRYATEKKAFEHLLTSFVGVVASYPEPASSICDATGVHAGNPTPSNTSLACRKDVSFCAADDLSTAPRRCELSFPPSRKDDFHLAGARIDDGNQLFHDNVAQAAKLRRHVLRLGWK